MEGGVAAAEKCFEKRAQSEHPLAPLVRGDSRGEICGGGRAEEEEEVKEEEEEEGKSPEREGGHLECVCVCVFPGVSSNKNRQGVKMSAAPGLASENGGGDEAESEDDDQTRRRAGERIGGLWTQQGSVWVRQRSESKVTSRILAGEEQS